MSGDFKQCAQEILGLAALHADWYASKHVNEHAALEYVAAKTKFRNEDYQGAITYALDALDHAVGEFHPDYLLALNLFNESLK